MRCSTAALTVLAGARRNDPSLAAAELALHVEKAAKGTGARAAAPAVAASACVRLPACLSGPLGLLTVGGQPLGRCYLSA